MKQLFSFLLLIIFFSCNTIDMYERTDFFPRHEWTSANKLTFSFTVSDTTMLYNLFVVLRHTDAYHFNNVWLNVITMSPEGAAQTQQINLHLADNTTGWLGSAMNDIIEHRIRITKYPVKLKQGNYTFILQQIMREDPLQNVLNAGVRVEKVVQ